MHRQQKSARTLLGHLLLLVGGFALSLGLAEALVRTTHPFERGHRPPGGLFEMDKDLGWKLNAGTTVPHHSEYFDVIYEINARGYRDPMRDGAKAPDSYRALLYGDSRIFGWGIPQDQRFSDRIERRVHDLELWNRGVVAYGLDQQVMVYEREGDSLEADEVIFFVSPSTLERNQMSYMSNKPKPRFVLSPDGTLEAIGITLVAHERANALYSLLARFHLPYFVDRRFKSLLTASREEGGQTELPDAHTAISELDKAILSRAAQLALERRHRLTILAVPEMAESARAFLSNHATVVLLDTRLLKENENLRFGEHDKHWNPQGNELIAEQLTRHFEEQLAEWPWHRRSSERLAVSVPRS